MTAERTGRPPTTLAGLLALVRWPGVLTASANAATGFLLVHLPGGPGPAAAGGVVGAAGLVYAGGVVLNDVVDADRDRELHPSRPIPTGMVGRRTAGAFGAALLLAGVLLALLLCHDLAAVAVAGAAVAALLYDLGGKRLALPGGLLLGLARGAVGVAGLLAGSGSLDGLVAVARGDVPELVAVAVWYPVAVAAYTLALTLVSTLEERTPGIWLAGGAAVFLAVVATLPWIYLPRGRTWCLAFSALPLAGGLVVGARGALLPGGPGLGSVIRQAVFCFLLVDALWLFGVGRHQSAFWLVLAYVALRLVLSRSRS